MSRHRNFHNMNYDEERDDSDDDYYGRSYEEEVAMSPSSSHYMYSRQRLTSTNQPGRAALADFIPEETEFGSGRYDDYGRPLPAADDDMFEMDDVAAPPAKPAVQASPLGPPPGFEQSTPRAQPAGFSVTRIDTPSATPAKEKAVAPNIESLRVSDTPHRSASKSPSRKKQLDKLATPTMTSCSSATRLSQLAAISSAPATPRRDVRSRVDEKEMINLVVVGHVDAGKSTMMGHVLVQLGQVDQRTMHKYKQESARSGKASFAFAWVLDETEEERARGVTMDIARSGFETPHRKVVLLDAPGHKDFVPNMITGASQADAAILVVNATRGEFETGFENGGQTKEHAMLLRSLGVSQLVVAVNKLDTVDWSEHRFKEVEAVMTTFLARQAGFSKVRFVPVSGLSGENLVHSPPADHPLMKWYKGKSLVDHIDSFKAPARAADGPLRIVINDVFKATSSQLSLSGKVESGEVAAGDKVYLMPNADPALVKSAAAEDGSSTESCQAGDQVMLVLTGTFEPDAIQPGHVVVRAGQDTLLPGRRWLCRLVVFDIAIPLMKGTKAELYAHSMCVPSSILRLRASINKATGEVIKQRPRCLSRQMAGLVEMETESDVAMEPFTRCRALGRVTLRANGQTIAAGIIEEKIEC